MTLEARTILYSRLVEVLGDAPAATLMSYLPGSEPATRIDLETAERRLGERMDGLEQRMDGLEQRMDRLEQRMDRLEQRMDHLSDRFGAELRAQTRTFIMASLGSTATLAASIVAAAALLAP